MIPQSIVKSPDCLFPPIQPIRPINQGTIYEAGAQGVQRLEVISFLLNHPGTGERGHRAHHAGYITAALLPLEEVPVNRKSPILSRLTSKRRYKVIRFHARWYHCFSAVFVSRGGGVRNRSQTSDQWRGTTWGRENW